LPIDGFLLPDYSDTVDCQYISFYQCMKLHYVKYWCLYILDFLQDRGGFDICCTVDLAWEN
jgi:hypothetical protein